MVRYKALRLKHFFGIRSVETKYTECNGHDSISVHCASSAYTSVLSYTITSRYLSRYVSKMLFT